jgi:hypothetical protein
MASQRQRCTEYREWFTPAVSAAATQRACSEACRGRRRRKLARARRRLAVDHHRVDERLRQQALRERRAAAEAGSPSCAEEHCHAPPSDRNTTEVHKELLFLWDELQQASRATLTRALPGILRRSGPRSGTTEAA